MGLALEGILGTSLELGKFLGAFLVLELKEAGMVTRGSLCRRWVRWTDVHRKPLQLFQSQKTSRRNHRPMLSLDLNGLVGDGE